MKWDPKLTGMIEFGDDDYEWDVYYPKKEKLYKFPRYKKIKLLSIKYKCRADVGDLAGMQIVSSNYVQTPVFETPDARNWT